jgi:hypothetical protein
MGDTGRLGPRSSSSVSKHLKSLEDKEFLCSRRIRIADKQPGPR